MAVTFRCDGAAMQSAKIKLEEAQLLLGEAYQVGKKIEDEITSKSSWESKSQETMSGYMDLLTQYHADLASGNTPIKDAEKALATLLTTLETFYEDWQEWKGLDNIV